MLLLLEEAFVSDQPGIDFQSGDFVLAPAALPGTKLEAAVRISEIAGEIHQSRQEQFLHHLIRSAANLSEESSPRPYYPVRNRPPMSTTSVMVQRDLDGAKRAWDTVVSDLLNRGYVDRAAHRPCVDDDSPITDQTAELDWLFTERLGTEELWRKAAENWTEDEFFGMVEVVHDVVARPRSRWYHDYNNCGWHYSAFAVYPAQILYRWAVNKILSRHGIDLELAKSGEDVGRLVHAPTDARADLLDRLAEP